MMDVNSVSQCEHCGSRVTYLTKRTLEPGHIHLVYECHGCQHQYSACSTDGYSKLVHGR